ncbi:hypothetical protein APHAL10511_007236 [Amanita phalloides]|nr:hypothetical protein APHAL10511_007236 [Amanita phalloides]
MRAHTHLPRFAFTRSYATQPTLVNLVEVGPRDGLQNEKGIIPLHVKVELINRLAHAGAINIEAGSFVSPKWVPQMAGTAQVLKSIDRHPNVHYPVLVPNKRGLDDLFALLDEHPSDPPLTDEVSIFTAATDAFTRANLNCTIGESLTRLEPVARAAVDRGLRVRGYVSVVIACPYSGRVEPNQVREVAKALVDMGCYQISLGDTVGQGTPDQISEMIEQVKKSIPVEQLAGHFHDTYGTAVANVLRALSHGVRTIDTSVGGLGGCPYSPGATGNVATEDVLYALKDSPYRVADRMVDKRSFGTPKREPGWQSDPGQADSVAIYGHGPHDKTQPASLISFLLIVFLPSAGEVSSRSDPTMVLISSKKYACETCIKGHRSSTCKHTDRPLYEIKKKGRPVTQCEHCRELRKTKQVHVKCICEMKADNSSLSQPPANGKKGTKIPQCAAFPNGLPQEFEAVISSQLDTLANSVQEGSISDPCYGVKEQNSCECKYGATCTCWTPRHSSAFRSAASISYHSESAEVSIDEQPQARLSMPHILARVNDLRPVLPRPTISSPPSAGPIHDLSSGMPHSIPNRQHMHDNVMFSPYGRAHDRTHDHPLGHEKHYMGQSMPYLQGDGLYERPMLELAASGSQDLTLGGLSLTSACNCRTSCQCAGCEPTKPSVPNLDANCASNVCTTCLECSYFSPSSSSATQQRSEQRVAIDEWLRQISVPTSGDTGLQQTLIKQEYPLSIDTTSQILRINSQSESIWDQFNSSDDDHTHASTPPDHCSYNDRMGLLQMSQGMSRSDTHLVLPEVYQTRPLSAPLQRHLGGQRSCMTNIADLPCSASMSALDVSGGADYVANSQSAIQALVDFAISNNTSSVTNLAIPWATGSDEGNSTSLMPVVQSYAVSNSGTDGTSSYDDLSMTLRTPL